ncbi:unnamed protein product [Cochlearia groenlandica]
MMITKQLIFVTILIVLSVFVSSNDPNKREYIHYPPTKGCDPEKQDCSKKIPANPYRRGCTLINRCRRDLNSLPPLKQFLNEVLYE